MKTKLPLGKSPLLCYPNYADIFSILDAYSKDYMDWIYNYFIQLTVPNNHELGHRLDFSVPRLLESLPWLNAERIDRKLSVDLCMGSYVQFLLNAIDHGKYIFTLLDTYYNHNYEIYNKKHFPHEHLIYGYDDENKYFLFADNFDMGKYNYGKVMFDEVENANRGLWEEQMIDWYDGTYLLSYRKNYDYGMCVFRDYYKHPFSLQLVYKLVNDYLFERPTELDWTLPNSLVGCEIETSKKCWGMAIYNYIFEYLDILAQNENSDIEFRLFYTLYEHKKIMKEIISHILKITGFNRNSYINEKCDESISNSSIIIKMLLKYQIKNNIQLLEMVKCRIGILRENDDIVMNYLLDMIAAVIGL